MVARAVDHEAFLQATLRHSELIHALARRLAPRPLDAVDIVQETYLRAYAAWGRRSPKDVAASGATGTSTTAKYPISLMPVPTRPRLRSPGSSRNAYARLCGRCPSRSGSRSR